MLYEMSGIVKVINEMQTFASGFTKREFVITTEDEKFPQDVCFSFRKEKCALLDTLMPGERVKVTFGISGREWQGKYFVNLDAIKFEKTDPDAIYATPDYVQDIGEPVVSDDQMPF